MSPNDNKWHAMFLITKEPHLPNSPLPCIFQVDIENVVVIIIHKQYLGSLSEYGNRELQK